MKTSRLSVLALWLLTASAAGIAATPSVGQCDLSDDAVIAAAQAHVTKTLGWKEESYELKVSRREDGSRTVVASPLPASPDAAILLIVECRAQVVREISSVPELLSSAARGRKE